MGVMHQEESRAKHHTAHTPAALNTGVIFLQSPRFAINLQKNEGGLAGLVGLFAPPHSSSEQMSTWQRRNWQL